VRRVDDEGVGTGEEEIANGRSLYVGHPSTLKRDTSAIEEDFLPPVPRRVIGHHEQKTIRLAAPQGGRYFGDYPQATKMPQLYFEWPQAVGTIEIGGVLRFLSGSRRPRQVEKK